MIDLAVKQLIDGRDVPFDMAREVMREIITGKASKVQMTAYLIALRMKGESIDEISASAMEVRRHCTRIHPKKKVLEIVGTGGDGANTFNISTTTAIVVASAKIPVAKHGNRGVSSKSGAADVLEALGVCLEVSPKQSSSMLEEINLCFLFAQQYHTAMRQIASVRKELGIRTMFHLIGPLVNPVDVSYVILGVYEEALVEVMAQVLVRLGVKRGLVVYGEDGMDEISLSAPTKVCEIRNKETKTYEICPEQFGLMRCKKEELMGGTPKENAQITLDILNGIQGPTRNAVLMNASACLYLIHNQLSFREGVKIAMQCIDEKKAKKKLEELIVYSNQEDRNKE